MSFIFLKIIYLCSMMLFGIEFAVIINLLNSILCMFVFMELLVTVCINIQKTSSKNIR